MSPVRTLPVVDVLVDGAHLDRAVAGAITEVRVRQALSVPAQCELVFGDPPGPLTGALAIRPGAPLQLRVSGHDVALFTGDVSAVEHGFEADGSREVRVRAYDPSQRLRRQQTMRAHVRVTPGALAAELAEAAGLTLSATTDGPSHDWLVQHRRSDLDLLVEALQRAGLYYAVRDGSMLVVTLEGIGDPLPLTLGASLLEARLELNAEAACSGVEVAGWDALHGRTHRGRATTPRAAAGAGRIGEAEGAAGMRSLVEQPAAGQDHADALAQAELDVRAARQVRCTGVAEGDPRLRPASRVTLAGVGAVFAGPLALTAVTHTIDGDRGYVSAIETEPPALAPRPAGAIVTEGVVTQVRDPERRGRVKVQLPGYFDVETDWMPVVTLGAGSGKGLQVTPDVDDTVLVLLAHADPAEGVVLGGLYGIREVPDAGGVVEGAVRRYQLRTSGGQVFRLDDEKRTVRVENEAGSYVELAPDGVTLHAAADLEIAAPGKRVLIRGRAIDFEGA